MVLRLQLLGLLKRCCRCPPSTNLKCAYSGLTTSSFSSTPSSAPTTSRALSITWTLRKDVPEPQDMEARPKLDLDVWKSVMKSQALEEAVDKDEEPVTAEENQGELSPLEASRRLVETWRLAGRSVPVNITDKQLEILTEMTSKTAKKKYLKRLKLYEDYKEKRAMKKAERMAKRTERMEQDNGDCKGVDGKDNERDFKVKNTYLMMFWTRSMDYVLGWRVAQAMQYGQPLVFDMSYDQHMSKREMNNTITQLVMSEGCNRQAVDPFHLHFCNLQPNGAYHRAFLKFYNQESWERLLITTSSQQHIDMFPREDLVYLTADSPNVLHTFDHNKVYIVGAFVDCSIQSGVSMANAKRLKLASARLPLDKYMNWESGAKNLTLDQMIQILLTVKETGSWEKALKFVPKRKHIGFYQQRTENNVPRPPDTENRYRGYRMSQLDRVPMFVSKKKLENRTVEKPAFKSEQISGQVRLRIGIKSKIEDRSKAIREKKNCFDNE